MIILIEEIFFFQRNVHVYRGLAGSLNIGVILCELRYVQVLSPTIKHQLNP